jgi:hypothetical protein
MRMQSSLPRLARRVSGIAGRLALGLQGNFLSRFLDFCCGFPGDILGGLTDHFLLHARGFRRAGHEQPPNKMAVAAGSPQKAAVAALGVGG